MGNKVDNTRCLVEISGFQQNSESIMQLSGIYNNQVVIILICCYDYSTHKLACPNAHYETDQSEYFYSSGLKL